MQVIYIYIYRSIHKVVLVQHVDNVVT
jgi:hypothetical protein